MERDEAQGFQFIKFGGDYEPTVRFIYDAKTPEARRWSEATSSCHFVVDASGRRIGKVQRFHRTGREVTADLTLTRQGQMLLEAFGYSADGVSFLSLPEGDTLLDSLMERIRAEVPQPKDHDALSERVRDTIGRRPIVTSFDKPYFSERTRP